MSCVFLCYKKKGCYILYIHIYIYLCIYIFKQSHFTESGTETVSPFDHDSQWVVAVGVFKHLVCLIPRPSGDLGLPKWLSGKETACQWRIFFRRRRFDPHTGKIPWRSKWQPTPVFLTGESHGQRSLVGYSPWGCKRVRHDPWAINTFRRLKPTQKSEGFHWKYGTRGLSSPPSWTIEHLSHSVSSWTDISEVLGHFTQMQPDEYEYGEVRRVNNRQDDEGEDYCSSYVGGRARAICDSTAWDPNPTEKEKRMAVVKIQDMFTPQSPRCKSVMSSTLHLQLFFFFSVR